MTDLLAQHSLGAAAKEEEEEPIRSLLTKHKIRIWLAAVSALLLFANWYEFGRPCYILDFVLIGYLIPTLGEFSE